MQVVCLSPRRSPPTFALLAGVWASAVGRMAGVKVPLIAMHHAYVVTERIEGIQVSRVAVGGRGDGCHNVWASQRSAKSGIQAEMESLAEIGTYMANRGRHCPALCSEVPSLGPAQHCPCIHPPGLQRSLGRREGFSLNPSASVSPITYFIYGGIEDRRVGSWSRCWGPPKHRLPCH